MFEYTGGFFDEAASGFGIGVQDFVEASLAHDHVHFFAKTGVVEEFLNVEEAGRSTVDGVFASATAEEGAADGDFCVVDGDSAVSVVDGEADFSAPQALFFGGAGEDDVIHFAAT